MHIIIAGTGKSSRNNTEALLEDYLSSNPDIKLVIPAFRGAFTPTQMHAAQLFNDKERPVIAIIRKDLEYSEMPEYSTSVELLETDDMLKEALRHTKGQKEGVFIAWNDDDPLSTALLQGATRIKVAAQDLTNGLLTIPPATDLDEDPEPNIPDEEKILEESNEYDDDDDDTCGFGYLSKEKVEELAQIFAKAIVKEFKDQSK